MSSHRNVTYPGLPWSPVVKNPPSNAGNVDSILSLGTKMPHAAGQISPCIATGAVKKKKERRKKKIHPIAERQAVIRINTPVIACC